MSEEINVSMETSKGTIRLKLFAAKTPITVASFVNLAQRGYYDGLNFHRVIDEFMIQGGCPNGDGRGGPGYSFEDECQSGLRHDKPGVFSMANSGPGTNGSQFFITHLETPWLDGKHTVFGEVLGEEDMNVVNNIVQGDTIEKITIENDTSDLMEKNASRVEEWNRVLGQ